MTWDLGVSGEQLSLQGATHKGTMARSNLRPSELRQEMGARGPKLNDDPSVWLYNHMRSRQTERRREPNPERPILVEYPANRHSGQPQAAPLDRQHHIENLLSCTRGHTQHGMRGWTTTCPTERTSPSSKPARCPSSSLQSKTSMDVKMPDPLMGSSYISSRLQSDISRSSWLPEFTPLWPTPPRTPPKRAEA